MDPQIPLMRERVSLSDNDRTTLLGMPNEILNMIAGCADQRTVRSMRLTCKRLHDNSTEIFGKTQLSTRRFVFSTRGVLAFYLLSKHPRFGRYLRSVEFSTFRLDLSLKTMLQLGKKRLVKKIKNGMGIKSEGSSKCAELLRLAKIFIYNSDQAAGIQTKGWSGIIHEMLVRGFNNLRVNNQDFTKVSVGVYDDFAKVDLKNICFRTLTGRSYDQWATVHQKGHGWEKLYGGLPWETWQHRPDVPLAYIARALHLHQSRPSLVLSLQAFTGQSWVANRFHKQTDMLRYLQQSYYIDGVLGRSLATFAGPYNDRRDVCVKDPLRMIKLHGKAARLEFRGLFVTGGLVSLLEVPIFPHYVEWGAFNDILLYPCLEELSIESCAMRAIDLAAVLLVQGDRLKKLKISRTTLIFDHHPINQRPVTHWQVMPLVFDLIQTYTQLEEISLDHVGLADANRNAEMVIGYNVYEEMWQGRQMICDRAAACAEALRTEWDDIDDIDLEHMRHWRTPTTAAFLSTWYEEGEQTKPPAFYDCSGQRIQKGLIRDKW